MKAKVLLSSEIDLEEIKIGPHNMADLLQKIHDSVVSTVQDISIQRQKGNPNLEDIDAELYGVLNLIEEVQRG